MSNNNHYFHFTLGPVQSFVSQARRTRDFWAGSFLLSWLSAVAIKSVTHQGGRIIFPLADDNYLAFLEGKGEVGKDPQQGSIPNRFKAEVTDLDSFKPEQVTQAVQEAWVALSEYVWNEDIVSALHDNPILERVGKVWDRQIPSFWDMSWVITDDIEDSSALDRRKNCRTYFTPDEPGVKCSMMNGWQELSGVATPNRIEMNKFWETLRKQGKQGIGNDLKENEYLSSIAYVKRRFSRFFEGFSYSMNQGWELKGWDVPSGVPSVSYMAAVHWLAQAQKNCTVDLLENFTHDAHKLTGNYGEWKTTIHSLNNSTQNSNRFNKLDGNVFYKNNLENKRMFSDQDSSQALLKLLKKVNDTENMEPVSPFYAVLMMDGDSLGINMSDITKQAAITDGLAKFTKDVPEIVFRNDGFLIYAGGDDVLAILPMEDAITCAASIREHYNQCFENSDLNTSLSGAIEFVHIKTPLTKILNDAHQLLDDIAKEQTGRDSLAIRVWKPGGMQLQWAQPWEIVLDQSNEARKSYIEGLADNFQVQDSDDEQFSSKFFFKIRDRFDLLNPVDQESPKVLNDEQAISLMAMEYLNSGKNELSKIKDSNLRVEKAKETIRPLLEQCRSVKRESDKNPDLWKKSPSLEVDAALLVRFLAHKGIER